MARLIGTGVAAAFLLALYFLAPFGDSDSSSGARLALDFDPADVDRLTIGSPSVGSVEIARAGDDWIFLDSAPERVFADQLSVERVIEALASIPIERRVELSEGQSIATFGLDDTATRITARIKNSKGAPGAAERFVALKIGARAPGGDLRYAGVDGDEARVFLIAASRAQNFFKSRDDFIDREIFGRAIGIESLKLRGATLRSLTIRSSNAAFAPVALAREQDGRWRFSEPISVEMKSRRASFFSADLFSIESNSSPPFSEKTDGAPFRAETEYEMALVFDDGAERSLKVDFSALEPESGSRLARIKLGSSDRVFSRVAEKDYLSLPRRIDDFLDDGYATLAREPVQAIRIDRPESFRARIERDRESSDWMLLEPTRARADEARVDELVHALGYQGGAILVAGEGYDPNRYFLANPKLTIELVGENGEKELVRFGAGDGGMVYVASDRRGYLLAMDEEIFAEKFDLSLFDLTDRRLFPYTAEEIHQARIERLGELFIATRSRSGYTLTGSTSIDLSADRYNQLIWSLLSIQRGALDSSESEHRDRNEMALAIELRGAREDILRRVEIYRSSSEEAGARRYLAVDESGARFELAAHYVTDDIVSILENLVQPH